jgi:hypothetical protein
VFISCPLLPASIIAFGFLSISGISIPTNLTFSSLPSGSLQPSAEDLRATNQIKEAGKVIGIELIDHIIISKGEWFSFTRERMQ